MSTDSVPVQRAFATGLGNIPYPLLSDFHPKGHVSQLYGIYNEERGTSNRSVIIIDKQGIIRYKKLFGQGLPNPEEMLAELDKL